ncbi:uncharacterized protein LOC105162227 [Sesamum indicum]|uniref:Uncharacterized protein LOC105162227 n=1 Tax=Sesamum indicum TaxID=4182 RepID=A0A6I9T429_SESIN|nr:uncharacterized protein LOC105162227 [Sesamum indicum]
MDNRALKSISRSREREPNVRDNVPVKGVIHTIAGRPEQGDSRQTRKRYERINQRTQLVMNMEPEEEIVFENKDAAERTGPQNDPMVIKMDIANFTVHKLLVDNGSSADIIFRDVLVKIRLDNSKLEPVRTPLVGFGGTEVESLGTIDLPVSLGEELKRKILMVKFLVLVPKASGKWRVCIDFTNLKKTCPKDPYPLQRIDALVDLTTGYELFSMMDAYQGATYQRLVNKTFKEQIGKLMEVYIDDMLVKSSRSRDHLLHLKQAFTIMRTFRMKLNPTKCTFGVVGGKFLRYMVSERGIQANPGIIEAILKLKSPTMIKQVQKLTVVLTNHPLQNVLAQPDTSGRLVKWAVELGEYDIEHQARAAEKAQVLADFVIELSSEPESSQEIGKWILHVDGSSNASLGGAGILIQGTAGVEIEVAARLSFPTTNNEAEHEALILELELANVRFIKFPDARTIEQILCRSLAMLSGIQDRKITMMVKDKSAITKEVEANAIRESSAWKDGIVEYLRDGVLPSDPSRARRLKSKAACFTLVDTQLYKRTIERPLLKCLDADRTEYVMTEIHEESYGNHSGGQSLAQKVIRQGFFWPP